MNSSKTKIKKEIEAVKDMVTDFVPKLTSTLLNPATWHSPESIRQASVQVRNLHTTLAHHTCILYIY